MKIYTASSRWSTLLCMWSGCSCICILLNTNLHIIRIISLVLDVSFVVGLMAKKLKRTCIFFFSCMWCIHFLPFNSSSDCGHWIKIGWTAFFRCWLTLTIDTIGRMSMMNECDRLLNRTIVEFSDCSTWCAVSYTFENYPLMQLFVKKYIKSKYYF